MKLRRETDVFQSNNEIGDNNYKSENFFTLIDKMERVGGRGVVVLTRRTKNGKAGEESDMSGFAGQGQYSMWRNTSIPQSEIHIFVAYADQRYPLRRRKLLAA